jgi:chaperone modulatory protein CbpM
MNTTLSTATITIGLHLGEDHTLELEAFAAACDAEVGFIRLLVDEGLVQPLAEQPAWCFGSGELARVRRIRRLQRDFEANLQSVAVMLDLIDVVERLQAMLHRAGMSPR